MKVGFGWRKNTVESQSTWPGTGQVTIHLASYPENGLMLPLIVADAVNNSEGRYLSFYASDRISMDRLTIDVGVRYDRSVSSLLEASRRANPLVPDLLPAMTARGLSNTHVFDILAPRIGLSYALGEGSDTLLRASYGQFASQLAAGAAQILASPISYSEVDYLAVDLNGDGLAQPDELLLDAGIIAAIGFDPNNPTSTDSVNRISPDLTSPRTHEVIFGLDRELPIPNSAFTTSVTYRRFTNFTWAPLIGSPPRTTAWWTPSPRRCRRPLAGDRSARTSTPPTREWCCRPATAERNATGTGTTSSTGAGRPTSSSA